MTTRQDDFGNSFSTEINIRLAKWLLSQLQSHPVDYDTRNELLLNLRSLYPNCLDIWDFLISFLNHIEQSEFDLYENVTISELNEDILGTELQRSYDTNSRKTLAANYTSFGSTRILQKRLNNHNISTVVDPFCGSGRLITSFLEKVHHTNDSIPKIFLNDLIPTAVLLALCRVIHLFKQYSYPIENIYATTGDAFANFRGMQNHFDLILINPPFTRTHHIDNNQRANLSFLDTSYTNIIQGQLGLHIYSLLLSDMILKDNGQIAAILPATTISSNYSASLQHFLLTNYCNIQIITSDSSKSFSEDSDFREILIIMDKGHSQDPVSFENVEEEREDKLFKSKSKLSIDHSELLKSWNWMSNFRSSQLLELKSRINATNLLFSGDELGLSVRRGVEMYGPDYFFIPNKTWSIENQTDNTITVKSKSKSLTIPAKYLVRSLRKPKLYIQNISPNINEFLLSIPLNTNEQWLKTYNTYSKKDASPALKKYGDEWYNHVNKQISVKHPYGHLFFIDKFSIVTSSVLCHYTDDLTVCSKNFYVLKNYSKIHSKLLTAWINSTFYLLLFLGNRREIGGSFGRMQISDLRKTRMFIDILNIPELLANDIIDAFDLILKMDLPPLPKQIGKPYRRKLDELFLKYLGIDIIFLGELYKVVSESLASLGKRDRSRSTRS